MCPVVRRSDMSVSPAPGPSHSVRDQGTEGVWGVGGNHLIRAFVNSFGPIPTGHWFLNTHPRRGAAMG